MQQIMVQGSRARAIVQFCSKFNRITSKHERVHLDRMGIWIRKKSTSKIWLVERHKWIKIHVLSRKTSMALGTLRNSKRARCHLAVLRIRNLHNQLRMDREIRWALYQEMVCITKVWILNSQDWNKLAWTEFRPESIPIIYQTTILVATLVWTPTRTRTSSALFWHSSKNWMKGSSN